METPWICVHHIRKNNAIIDWNNWRRTNFAPRTTLCQWPQWGRCLRLQGVYSTSHLSCTLCRALLSSDMFFLVLNGDSSLQSLCSSSSSVECLLLFFFIEEDLLCILFFLLFEQTLASAKARFGTDPSGWSVTFVLGSSETETSASHSHLVFGFLEDLLSFVLNC